MMTEITLESVAKDMKHWRETRIKRGPIPEDLKKKILTLPARYPIITITKALNINTGQLKPKAKTSAKKMASPLSPSHFIKVEPPIQCKKNEKIVCSFKRPDGAILDCTIESTHVNQLLQAFLCSR